MLIIYIPLYTQPLPICEFQRPVCKLVPAHEWKKICDLAKVQCKLWCDITNCGGRLLMLAFWCDGICLLVSQANRHTKCSSCRPGWREISESKYIAMMAVNCYSVLSKRPSWSLEKYISGPFSLSILFISQQAQSIQIHSTQKPETFPWTPWMISYNYYSCGTLLSRNFKFSGISVGFGDFFPRVPQAPPPRSYGRWSTRQHSWVWASTGRFFITASSVCILINLFFDQSSVL